MSEPLTSKDLVVGGFYNWKGQPERLSYIGAQRYNGDSRTWHQFALVDVPGDCWCEVLDWQLNLFEVTERAAQAAQPEAVGWKLSDDELTLCHSHAVLSKKHDGSDPGFTTLLYRQIESAIQAKLASAPTPEPMSAPTAEPVATLWVQMETHDMGQSLAPNPPFKAAIAKAHTAAKDLPLGEYLLYATPPSAATPEPSDAEPTEAQIDAYCEAWGAAFEAEEPEAFGVTVEPLSESLRRCIVAGLRAAIRATKGGKL